MHVLPLFRMTTHTCHDLFGHCKFPPFVSFSLSYFSPTLRTATRILSIHSSPQLTSTQ